MLDLPEIPDSLYTAFESLAHKLNSLEETNIQKLDRIYQWLDDFLGFVNTFTRCDECDGRMIYCCNADIHITRAEAEYLAHYQQLSVDKSRTVSRNNWSPCPFLKNKRCSVYQHRPFNCRTLHTLDAPWKCYAEVSNFMIGSAQHGYGIDLFQDVADYLLEISRGVIRDIRDFFPEHQN